MQKNAFDQNSGLKVLLIINQIKISRWREKTCLWLATTPLDPIQKIKRYCNKNIKRHFSSKIFFLCKLKIFIFGQSCL